MKLQGRTRQWAIYGLRLAFGLGILIACFTLLDVSALPEAFARLDAFWLFVTFVLNVIGTILLPAMVSKRALGIDRIRMTLGELVAVNFTTRFYSLILPRAFSYGMRWLQYRRAGTGSDALALMGFEQMAQCVIMTSVTAIVLAFEYPGLGTEGLGLFVLMGSAAILFIAAMTPYVVPATTRWLVRIVTFGERFAPEFIYRPLHRLLDAVRAFQSLKAHVHLSIVLLSLLSIAVIVLNWYLLARALGIGISPWAILWIRGVLFLLLLSPVTVGGIGIREAGIAGLMHLYGVPAYEALALSLTLFGAQVATGLVGAGLELWRYLYNPSRRAGSHAGDDAAGAPSYSATMGVADPATGWVPSPTYILRRAAILDWLKKSRPGRVLEIGCGPGALLGDLARAGYDGLGVENSADARRIAPRLIGDLPGIVVADRLPEQPTPAFDYVMAFEVLEHIENDSAALTNWLRYLRPDGQVMLSLPAHRHRWNVTDIAAGHFRRYDRADVEALLRDAGLRIERLGSYGWPLSRINEALRLVATRRSLRRSGIDPADIARGDADRTAQSGVDRRLETRLFPLYGGMLGRAFFSLAIAVQRLSYDSSRGISFLVLARKVATT